MTNLFANQSSKIAAGHAVSGIADREQTLRVVCGQVWITIEGSRDDYWLSAGESLKVAPGKLVVIEADRLDSRVNLPQSSKQAQALQRQPGSFRHLIERIVRQSKALVH